MRIARAPLVLACAAALSLGAAAGASGAVTWGSALVDSNANTACPSAEPVCTYVQTALPLGESALEAPASGVVVRWRIKGPTNGGNVTFRVIRVAETDVVTSYTSVESAPAKVPSLAAGEVKEFPVQLPVRAGDHIGFDKEAGMFGLFRAQTPVARSAAFIPPLVHNQARLKDQGTVGQLLVQAEIEPDVDNDGFGDETQDSCAAVGVCQDVTPPVLSGLRMRPKAFYPRREKARAGASKPAGSLLRFTASEPARVSVELFRSSRGVPGGKRVGSFDQAAVRGQNLSYFSGKLGKRYLRPGRYRASLVARDGAGNASAPSVVRFRILGPRR